MCVCELVCVYMYVYVCVCVYIEGITSPICETKTPILPHFNIFHVICLSASLNETHIDVCKADALVRP